jgi:hypothetical protein
MSYIGQSFSPQFTSQSSKKTHTNSPQFGSHEAYYQYYGVPEQNPYEPTKPGGGVFKTLIGGALAIGAAILAIFGLKNTQFGKDLLQKAGDLPVVGSAVKYIQESSVVKAIPTTFDDIGKLFTKVKDSIFGFFKSDKGETLKQTTQKLKID